MRELFAQAGHSYIIETATTPALTVSNNMVADVIDAAGAQTIHIASGGKLDLSGASGENVIVFDAYAPGALTVSYSGSYVIFSDGAAQIASIETNATDGASNH